ncbi:MAG: LysE family transporter [Pirellulaceae bacterium]|nr:LysE family transporter [Pirellulaceae bacterium]
MIAFLISAVAVSLSGVMAPGPVTAATLAAGARSRHAGAWIALGHAAIEMPLILLLAAGVGTFFRSPAVKAGIGLVGGAVLILMGVQLLLSLRQSATGGEATVERHPFMIGVVLTGANPYFLFWWATVGLALATQAAEYGAVALLIFAVVHWCCDLVWLEILSWAGFKGSQTFGLRSQKVISVICAVVLVGFGLKFLYDSGVGLVGDLFPRL